MRQAFQSGISIPTLRVQGALETRGNGHYCSYWCYQDP
jgi:hypothetical protein